jgi:VanZ family protein
MFGLFLAVSTEAAQKLLPYRSSSFNDLLAGVAGVSLTLLLYALLRLR